ncbi:L-asparaginase/archaeal Glu-tRNAGln amidotransferase subunit D [Pseudomonas syringae pv. actinidiae]|uniref:L-asparaginase/archaeal Glu-tRNAGln amidotransferase subunit D n=1 Tax=Pseudomonas syringae pv. actinidiae TaxID=103796 RepID=A0A2V0QZP0_PSESF|nr:L-asparaginase/archaeal Glu-tRNAGln amidotransferase subunit D [Pseudomonas syringae pv. actinidiae]
MLFHVRQALLPYVAQLSIATLLGRLLHTFKNISQAKVFPEKLGEADQDAGAHQVQTVIVLLVQANALDAAVHVPRIVQGFHQTTQRRRRDTRILGNATLGVQHIAAIFWVDVAQHAGGQVQSHQQLLGHALDGQELLPPGTPVAMNAIQAAQVLAPVAVHVAQALVGRADQGIFKLLFRKMAGGRITGRHYPTGAT